MTKHGAKCIYWNVGIVQCPTCRKPKQAITECMHGVKEYPDLKHECEKDEPVSRRGKHRL